MADIQSAAAEIRQGKKERRKKERTNHSMKIYNVSLFHRATINQSVQIHIHIHILTVCGLEAE